MRLRVQINNRTFLLSLDEFCKVLHKGILPARIDVIDYLCEIRREF